MKILLKISNLTNKKNYETKIIEYNDFFNSLVYHFKKKLFY